MLTKTHRFVFYLDRSTNERDAVDLADRDSFQVLDIKSVYDLDKNLKSVDLDNSHVVIILSKNINPPKISLYLAKIKSFVHKNFKVIMSVSFKDSFLDTIELSDICYVEKEDYDKNCLEKVKSFFSNEFNDDIVLDGHSLSGLTIKQKALIQLFLNSENREVERHTILENVWGDLTIQPKTVDVHLYNLRRKIHPYGYLIRSEGGGRWKLLSERIDQNES